MASLQKRNDTGAYALQFYDRHNVRRTISLGVITKREAETIKLHVEKIASAQHSSAPLDRMSSIWISEIGEKLRQKLARHKLIEECRDGTLGQFIDDFIKRRRANPAFKESTFTVYKPVHESLRSYFGNNASLRSITKGDAQEWILRATKGKAPNTVRKWTRVAKTLFNSALDHGLIDTSPFDGMAYSNIRTTERHFYINDKMATDILNVLPTNELKLIFALLRYGGLRCPSELLELRWGDILWDKKRFIVRCVKVERHEGHETRVVPLFGEIEPLLQQAFDEAPEGSELIVSRSATNIRTHLENAISQAGLQRWPKLFQNLRSSRATELCEQFPNHVVAAWLGHSIQVAKLHYWQVTDDHFERAIGCDFTAQVTAVTGGSGPKRVEN